LLQYFIKFLFSLSGDKIAIAEGETSP